jgi:putative FmdB family regulatory protein
MPLYEYQCSKCDKIFEVIEKFADTPLTVHEGCGGKVERLLSAPAFQLKGSGWYATDYPKAGAQKKDEKGANGTSDSKDSKDSKSSESKSDSKPAPSETKGESKPAASTTKKD